MFVSVMSYILIAAIMACVVMIIATLTQQSGDKKITGLVPVQVLTQKENTLYGDLRTVCEKMGFLAYAKVPLNCIVEAERENRKHKIKRTLMGEFADFVVCEQRTLKPLLVIIPAESENLKRPNPVGASLESAGIPFIQLGNYNITGLEKAVRDKLAPDK